MASRNNHSWKSGDGRSVTLNDLTKLYRDLMNQSIPTSASIHKLNERNFNIKANFKTTDCDMMEMVKTFKSYSLGLSQEGKTIDQVHLLSGPHDLTELMSVTSNNLDYIARLKSGSSDSKKQILEIWYRSRLLKSIDIGEVSAHGLINTDPHFSRMLWTPYGNQDKLLYVCHAKKPKPSQPFKKSSTIKYVNGKSDDLSKVNQEECDEGKAGEDFLHREDWGECLDGVEHTILALLDVENEKFKIITIEVDKFSLGEPFWLDNGTKIGSVGWSEEPRRIGLIYCNNRPSKIYVHDWQSAAADTNHENLVTELSLEDQTLHSPRVNNGGNQFLYLVNDSWGPHLHPTEVYLYDLRERTSRKLRFITGAREQKIENALFVQDLPYSCFSNDDNHILFTTHDNLFSKLILYNLKTEMVTKIGFPIAGVSLFDFKYDLIVASGSDINMTPALFVAKINVGVDECVAWHQMENWNHYDDVSYETRIVQVPHETKASSELGEVSFILITPGAPSETQSRNTDEDSSSANKGAYLSRPTVVIPHGGPHSAFSVGFMTIPVIYAKLGMRTMLINYRGSTGVSEEYTRMLNGHVGTMDVNDVLNSVKFAIDKRLIDADKLVISGGSHGGFLACHLSGTEVSSWGFDFKSAIIRNPVVELFAMSLTSDIPDWIFNQALGEKRFQFGRFPDADTIARIYETSPVAPSRSQYRIPTLMLLGTKDRRVPMHQGLRWYEMLKAQGVDTKCKVYQDKHGLDRVEVAADSFLATVAWIFEHLPSSVST